MQKRKKVKRGASAKQKVAKRQAKRAASGTVAHTSREIVVRAPALSRKGVRVNVNAPSNATDDSVAAEAEYNVRAMDDNAQISRGGTLQPSETHALEAADDGGPPRVVRKRFSAI